LFFPIILIRHAFHLIVVVFLLAEYLVRYILNCSTLTKLLSTISLCTIADKATSLISLHLAVCMSSWRKHTSSMDLLYRCGSVQKCVSVLDQRNCLQSRQTSLIVAVSSFVEIIIPQL